MLLPTRPPACMSAVPLATKYAPLRMLRPASTLRLPPPTVVMPVRLAFAYHVVGRDTESWLMSPPAVTDTLPPTLIRPWSKLAKLIDDPLPSAALPVCIHCHQYCEMSVPTAPLVTRPVVSTTAWMALMSPRAARL